MKKIVALASFSIAALLLFGWMLATPLLQINPTHSNPAVADGTPPQPPPPYLVADGTPPQPPPPYLLADGTPPQPPPPYNV